MLLPDPPIICQHCQKDTGYTNRGLMHFVIPQGGLQCKSCGKTFLEKPGVTWCSSAIKKVEDRLDDAIVGWDGK